MDKTSQRAKINPVEAEDNGEVIVVGEDATVLPIGEHSMGEDGILVAEDADQVDLILWRAIGAECVAIWPVTIPAPRHSH